MEFAAHIALVAGLIFLAFYGHFVIIAGSAYLVLWRWFPGRFERYRIQNKPLHTARPKREFILSTWFSVFFSLLLTVLWVFAELGWTAFYTDVAEYGWGWFFASILVLALVHDTYYYWAHRFMHHPRVFRYVHKVHHQFHNPTPFASYAFHPLEAIIESAWVPPLIFLVPIHPAAFAIYVVILTVLNVISHLGYEFYKPWVAKWFITSLHHNMHHSRGRGHYMLYFNIWDRLMGTNAADYEARMRAMRAKASAATATGET